MAGGFWDRVFGRQEPVPLVGRVQISVIHGTTSLPSTPAPRDADGGRDVVGAGYMAVHGESFKRANLDRLMRNRRTGSTTFPEATLRPEPHPKHANAVKVLIQGEHVGYLPRAVADEFSDAFGGKELKCGAEVRRKNPSHDWNVVLRVDYDKLRRRAADARAQVREAAQRPKLDAVSSSARVYNDAVARQLRPDQVAEFKRLRDQAIREARRPSEHRPTLALVAEAAGISPNTVSKIAKADPDL